MTKILSLLATAVALAAISACGTSTAVPDHASSHKASHCLKVSVFSYSPAEQKATLRYWTPTRMKSATGFNSASLSSILGALRHHQHTSASTQSACFRRSTPATAAPVAP
jgi:hypothetical protein